MNVLIVGGEKGSWQMRGKQIGQAIGARYCAKAHQADWKWPDVAVLVKRAPESCFKAAKESGVPLVWDVLDFWRQPRDNQASEETLLKYVRDMAQSLGNVKLIGATKAMAKAIGGVYVPHHSRVAMVPTEVRPKLRSVAYEGSFKYLGRWEQAIRSACDDLGLQFLVNPRDIRDADVLVAFRDGEWDGWACRQWKSGIKYVNAIASGRPIITQESAAFQEIRPRGLVIEDVAQLRDAILAFESERMRRFVLEEHQRRAKEFRIESVAQRYLEVIRSVTERAA